MFYFLEKLRIYFKSKQWDLTSEKKWNSRAEWLLFVVITNCRLFISGAFFSLVLGKFCRQNIEGNASWLFNS